MQINDDDVWDTVRENGQRRMDKEDEYKIDCDGYTFICIRGRDSSPPSPSLSPGELLGVVLRSGDMSRTTSFWGDRLKMVATTRTSSETRYEYPSSPGSLTFHYQDSVLVDHAEAFGRVAFACPRGALKGIEGEMEPTGNVHTPFIALDTPGKKTVEVVILKVRRNHFSLSLPLLHVYLYIYHSSSL